MIIKHGKHILGEIHEVRKGMWAFFLLEWAFQMPVGWGGELQSHDTKDSLQVSSALPEHLPH